MKYKTPRRLLGRFRRFGEFLLQLKAYPSGLFLLSWQRDKQHADLGDMLQELNRPALKISSVKYDEVRSPKPDVVNVDRFFVAEANQASPDFNRVIQVFFEIYD